MKDNRTSSKGVLLEKIADELQCVCISDLKAEKLRSAIYWQLQNISPDDYSLEQWQEAADYLLEDEVAYEDSAEAQVALLSWSRKS